MWKAYDDFVAFDDDDVDWSYVLEEKGDDNYDVTVENTDNQPPVLSGSPETSSLAVDRDIGDPSVTSTHGYDCPFCSKHYKSASGFRWHVKKHHHQDVKASQHKHIIADDNLEDNLQRDGSKNDIKTPSVSSKKTGFVNPHRALDLDELSHNMPNYIQQAFEKIRSDPNLNFETSVHGKDISELAHMLEMKIKLGYDITTITEVMVKVIWKVLSAGDKMTLYSTQNEEIWHTFYNEWIDTTTTKILSTQFYAILEDTQINDFHIFLLTRIFLFELIKIVRTIENNAEGELNAHEHDVSLSNEEKQALRYFAGYIPFKIMKKLNRAKGGMTQLSDIIDDMRETDNDHSGGCMAATKTWLHKQDRGGLFNITDRVFLFFEEVEKVCKKHLTNKILNISTRDVHSKIQDDLFANRKVNILWSCVARKAASEEASSVLATMVIKL
ncbi:uncharacterized protein LOC102805596, partial [Saccoglossus kowalevskii]|uniref:Uncharacterized protein LOC102805596 n=1 Tax=Saccoglossus kowalevskii TaxID=10224 RepID=A0ABM0MV32_SACKO